ncbi:hypothetical protein OC861_006360 [Tilletia horrida]|nr:hypothetical protein OC845_003697 [Tilletia horrida]KAK0560216.1 hypothetical protein OC861_006360 [Tilletia horrida]
MKHHLLAFFFAFLSLLAAAAHAKRIDVTDQRTSSERRTSKTAVIAVFKNDNLYKPASNDRTPRVNTTFHDGFVRFLNQRKIAYTSRFNFTDDRMPLAMSLSLFNAKDVGTLYAYPPVQSVEQIQSGGVNSFQKHVIRTSQPHQAHQSRAASAALPKDVYGPHIMIGADLLHNEGQYGAGVKIGVVDTGVDHTHPAFGNCYGKPGCTVVGGYGFVSDSNSLVQTKDSRPDCNNYGVESSWGHGTHVAGVVGADDRTRNFTGIVPKAFLSPYRIAGCTGNSAPDIAAAGLQRAFFDGMDVISMSFSFPPGWSSSFISTLANRLTELGAVVVTSLGNGGESGLFVGNSPAIAPGVHSVAAVENQYLSSWTYTIAIGTTQSSSTYLSNDAFQFNKSAKLPVYTTSKRILDPNDACNQLPSSTPDLSKYAVLIAKAKNCVTTLQINNAKDAGAKVIIIYNDKTDEPIYVDEYLDVEDTTQAAGISYEDGVKIANAIYSKKTVTLDFSKSHGAVQQNNITGGLIGDYSEYGPTWDAGGVPSSAGIGGLVMSTWPVNAGSYAVLSGTSFSTPMVAGAMALYKSIKGNTETPKELSAIFMSTAKPVPYAKDSPVLDTVARQGAGLINIYQAVKSISRVTPAQLLLNDTHFFQGNQDVTIKNIGSVSQQFTVQHLPAGTVYAQDGSGKGVYYDGPVRPVAKDQATVKFSPASFTVAPGQSQKVGLTFTHPSADPLKLAVYSGYVQIKSNQEFGTLTVPYLGIGANFSSLQTLNTTRDEDDGIAQPTLRGQSANTITANETFSLNSTDQPSLVWGLNLGSPLATVLLVNANTTYTPSLRQGSSKFTPVCSKVRSSDVVATILTSRNKDRDLGDPSYTFIGSTWTDSKGVTRKVPNGKFRVLLRVLKPNSDPANDCSYESFLSRAFTVKQGAS